MGPTDALAALPPNYRDAAVVGSGAQGTVYRATREDTGNVVALKAVRTVRGQLPPAVQNELNVLKSVPGHEGFVDIRAVSCFEELGWLEMPYCPSTLHAVLQQPPRRPGPEFLRQALQWAEQLSGAVAHLHSKKLVHRDIKPDNVLIDVADNARLGDFGLARSANELATAGPSRVGTPKYMAPETSRGPATPASDVYALGVLLNDIRAVFGASDRRSSVTATAQTTVTELDPAAILTALDSLTSRMTSPEARKRPTAIEATEVLHRLHLESAGIADRRRHSRRWVITLSAAVAVLIAMASLTWLHLLTTHHAQPSAWARFDNPSSSEPVTSPLVAHGHAKVPQGKVLWVMVQPPAGAYYPVVRRPVAVDASGTWSVTVNLGNGTPKAVGLAYDLFAVLAPASSSAIQAAVRRSDLAGRTARFDPLPTEATPLSQVHVKLAGYPTKGI